MITQKQLDKWRHAEMVKTTMPLESELLEAAAWDVVGQLIEEVERQWAIWSSKLLQMHALEEKNDNQAEEIELLKGELESLQAGLGEDIGRDRAEAIIDEATNGPRVEFTAREVKIIMGLRHEKEAEMVEAERAYREDTAKQQGEVTRLTNLLHDQNCAGREQAKEIKKIKFDRCFDDTTIGNQRRQIDALKKEIWRLQDIVCGIK